MKPPFIVTLFVVGSLVSLSGRANCAAAENRRAVRNHAGFAAIEAEDLNLPSTSAPKQMHS